MSATRKGLLKKLIPLCLVLGFVMNLGPADAQQSVCCQTCYNTAVIDFFRICPLAVDLQFVRYGCSQLTHTTYATCTSLCTSACPALPF
jgi:hypothetical protein